VRRWSSELARVGVSLFPDIPPSKCSALFFCYLIIILYLSGIADVNFTALDLVNPLI
jgi:hypothetical protein